MSERILFEVDADYTAFDGELDKAMKRSQAVFDKQDREFKDQLRNQKILWSENAKAYGAKMAEAEQKVAAARRGVTEQQMRLQQGLNAVFGDQINKVGQVSGAFGAMGLSVGTVVGGLALIGAGVIGVAAVGAAAYETTSFLYGAAVATKQLDEENRALDVASEAVYETIGRKVAPTFRGLTIGVVAGTLALNDFVVKVFDVTDKLQAWYAALGPVGKGIIDGVVGPGLRQLEVIGDLGEGFNDGTLAMGGYLTQAEQLADSLENLDGVTKGAVQRNKDAAKAAREAAEALRIELALYKEKARLSAEAYDAGVAIDKIQRDSNSDLLTKQDQIMANRDAEIDQINEQFLKSGDMAKSATAEAAVRARANRDAAKASRDAWLEASGDVAQGIQDVTDFIVESAKGGSKAQQQAALVAFRVNQVAGSASVGINTAVAITKALADLGPVGGAVAGVGIAATGAAQVAAIWGQEPPQVKHGGGGIHGAAYDAPDETNVRGLEGEFMLTRQGVRNAGGEEVVRSFNRNAGDGRSAGAQVLAVGLDHRFFNATVRRNIQQTNSPLRQAVASAAAGYYGHRKK